mgnify:CR=1 FL=1
MATSKEFHDYIIENLQRAGIVSSRKMMGEYIVYYQDKLVGMICDNCFFLKPTEKVLQLFSYELLLLKGIGIGHKAEETIKQYQERVFYIKPQFEGAGLKEMFQIYMDSYYGKVHPKEEEIEKVVFCVKETEKCYQGIRKIIIVFWKCFT